MLGKYRIETKVVKKSKDDDHALTMNEIINPDSIKLIEETGRKLVKQLVLTIVVTVVAITLIDTIGNIITAKYTESK